MGRAARPQQLDGALRREDAHVVQREVAVRGCDPLVQLPVARVACERLRLRRPHDDASGVEVVWPAFGAVRGEQHRDVKVPVLRGDQHRRSAVLRARVDASARLAQQRGASQRA